MVGFWTYHYTCALWKRVSIQLVGKVPQVGSIFPSISDSQHSKTFMMIYNTHELLRRNETEIPFFLIQNSKGQVLRSRLHCLEYHQHCPESWKVLCNGESLCICWGWVTKGWNKMLNAFHQVGHFLNKKIMKMFSWKVFNVFFHLI